MTPAAQTWIMVGCLKLVAVTTFGLVYFKKLPPAFLILIPLFYIGTAIMALRNRVPGAAALCGIILVLLVVVYFIPGPARDAFVKAIYQ